MSERITSTVYGFAPPSAELLQISSDIDRGRATAEEYDAQASADFGVYSGVLEAAGIDFRSGDWAGASESDYLRDSARLFSGFRGDLDKSAVTRWFDTNTFYRQPVLEDLPEKQETYPHKQYLDWLSLTGSDSAYQPTFLSPYAFYRLADTTGIPDKNALALSNALYSQLLADAIESGVRSVLFHELFIPYENSSAEERAKFIEHLKPMAEFYKDLSKFGSDYEGLDISLFFSNGDASAVINDVVEQDVAVSSIGCDLQKTPLERIGSLGGRALLAGLVDGANTLFVEDDEVARRLEEASTVPDTSSVSLTHTVDLEHVPRFYAQQKIIQIGLVAALVNGRSKK
ncbi:MAG TPA: hypothetical protein VFK11_04245 [Candidatus Saccharimonadales bacterium]|nr:hypothetical protein [Candidatus Saccharimonadales bacterium]